jgi:enamine deaminase RidA (YjgF/YER057c/UK114 family)
MEVKNMLTEQKLAELGITLPEAPAPVATYVPWKIVGNMLYVSGQGPMANGKVLYTGKLGVNLTVEEGYQSARYCAFNLLAQMKKAVGDLDRIVQIIRLTGYVASADTFTQQPKVINGATDLLFQVFGQAGIPTRCAVGVNVLPFDTPTEVDLMAEIRETTGAV